MEDWLYCSLAITSCVAVSLLLSAKPAKKQKPSLPPGPTGLSIIGLLLFIGWTSVGIELLIRAARAWYGPVFTLHLLPAPVVFVADGAVARRVLVQGGAAFADPSRLLRRYAASKREGSYVVVEGLLHRAVFHVFARMCFGDGPGDDVVAAVTTLQREFLTSVVGFHVFSVVPAVTRLVYRRRWDHMMSIRRRQEELFIPLIQRRRRDAAAASVAVEVDCYVDSLLGLRVPDEEGQGRSRNLTEREMVSLCSEFLAGGTDSTVAVMQWTMAELVAHPEIQAKLQAEIHDTCCELNDEEDHLLLLEGLRRHPPGKFMLPHAATDAGGAAFDGFHVPRHAMVNFALGGMAMDEAVWPDPRRFRPGVEGEGVDLTGAREINSKYVKLLSGLCRVPPLWYCMLPTLL